MSGQDRLERGYRRALACYPRSFRRDNEEEILAVLLATAEEGRVRVGLAEAADLVRGALRMRLWSAMPTPRSIRAAVRLMYAGAAAELTALLTMASPSPAGTEQQFQIFGGHRCNLDRCNRCGAPRSVHGPDWGCPSRSAHATARVLLAMGGLLALAGLIAQVIWRAGPTPAQTGGSLTAILIGVTLLVAGAITARRPG